MNKKSVAKASSRPMSLVEAVMWGTAKQVKDILEQRELECDKNWSDYNLLTIALKRKRKEIAKILLSKGCRVQRYQIISIDTPLHLAVANNDIESVKLLLDRGASINEINQNAETPVHLGMKKCYNEIVDLLLNDNINNEINTSNRNNLTHFHIACMRNNVQAAVAFIKSGVDINDVARCDSSGNFDCTPLHLAVNYGSRDIIQLLLQHNADVNIVNRLTYTPLHSAVIKKRDDHIANLILSSSGICNTNPSNNFGFSHFHIACMKNHMNAVEQFLLRGVEINGPVESNSDYFPGYTPLHFAVKGLPTSMCQASMVELLLRHKANVNAQDTKGQTPLHLLCLQNNERTYNSIEDVILAKNNSSKNSVENYTNIEKKILDIINKTEQIEVVQLLLKHKSDLNIKNISKETPLFYLYKFDRSKIIKSDHYSPDFLKNVIKILNDKRKEIVKIFLENNADINICNDKGQTILHIIANINRMYDDDTKEDIAELILSKGANVDAKDNHGLTPLHVAARNGHSKLIELFLKYKADINNVENINKSTPLHLSTMYQQVDAINVLLNHGADVTITKSNCMNVLHIMALVNPEISEEPLFVESYEKLIETFIDYGCDINAQDVNGRTPLHLACWEHNSAGAWTLIQHFPDVNIEDCGDETVLSCPINSSLRCLSIYNMLKDYVSMLKVAGLPISKKAELAYTKLFGSHVSEQDTFLDDCKREVEIMCSTKINNNTTLHSILFKSSEEMEVYARNEIFKSILKSHDFNKKFELFGNFLRSQYKKGLIKKKLLKSAKDSLEFMIGFRLPDTCTDQILQYLDDANLRNMTKAKSIKLDCKKKEKIDSSPSEQDESVEKALAYCKNLFNRQMEMEIT